MDLRFVLHAWIAVSGIAAAGCPHFRRGFIAPKVGIDAERSTNICTALCIKVGIRAANRSCLSFRFRWIVWWYGPV